LGAWLVIRVVGTLLLIQDRDMLNWCLDVLRGYLGVCDWRWGNFLCSEANEKPDMAAVIEVVEPSLGIFRGGLGGCSFYTLLFPLWGTGGRLSPGRRVGVGGRDTVWDSVDLSGTFCRSIGVAIENFIGIPMP
jgi:hypothetical protein